MTTEKDSGGYAFPRPLPIMAFKPDDCLRIINEHAGLSKRDYLAAKALQGFCANPAVFAPRADVGWGLVNASEDQLATYCFFLADAVIKAGIES